MAALFGLLLLFVASASSRSVNNAPLAKAKMMDLSVIEAVLMWQLEGRDSVVKFPGKTGKGYSEAFITLNSPFTFDSSDVKFHLYTKSDESDIQGTIVSSDKASLVSAGWDESLETRIVIHGFDNDITSPIIQLIKNNYLQTGKYNVIGVDWGDLCPAPLYVTAVANVRPTGLLVGQFIDALISQGLSETSKIHVIGHSLGAHVAGIAAGSTTNGMVSRVTGLDPALPLFEWASADYRLDENDADIVDVIHTSGGGLGFSAALGTVDFYPNGGQRQPGCGIDLADVCAHGRSYEYFAESILDSSAFPSAYCKSASNAEKDKCNSADNAIMGDALKFSNDGSYYLKTGSSPPYTSD